MTLFWLLPVEGAAELLSDTVRQKFYLLISWNLQLHSVTTFPRNHLSESGCRTVKFVLLIE